MIKNAEKSVVLVTSAKGLVRKADEFSRVFRKAKEKGVKIRIAAPITKNSKNVVADLEKYADIRNTNIPARFLIIDGQELAFMVMDDENVHPSMMWASGSRQSNFAGALQSMFDNMWKDMAEAK